MSDQVDCPNCGSTDHIEDPETGERICKNCGYVISEYALDRGPEWRAFTPEERESKRRTGSPLSNVYYDRGLSTTFDPRDARGTSEETQRMWRLKKRDTRTKLSETGARNLKTALKEMDRMADALHLPRGVKEEAIDIYRQTLEEDLIIGQTIDGFVAASLYAACRRAKIPRSLKEVAGLSTQDIKTVSRIYRQILRELDLRMPIDYPMKFVPRIANKVKVTPRTDQLTVEILREARQEKALAGKDPRGMAAAALYMACKHNKEGCTQREVSEAAGTSEVTLRNRLRDLEEIFREEDLETIMKGTPR
ncbi:transcription initiation factor IIB [Candidatus Bathyarchaeota archaeon]|nr:transcription initiation factor IIB [Candidatus Bathyarchaeota archaeon]